MYLGGKSGIIMKKFTWQIFHTWCIVVAIGCGEAGIKEGAEDGSNDNQLRKLHDKTNSFDEPVMATVLSDNHQISRWLQKAGKDLIYSRDDQMTCKMISNVQILKVGGERINCRQGGNGAKQCLMGLSTWLGLCLEKETIELASIH